MWVGKGAGEWLGQLPMKRKWPLGEELLLLLLLLPLI